MVIDLHVCPWTICMKPDKDIESPGTRVTSGYESSCRCRELSPDPLEEQPVFAHFLSFFFCQFRGLSQGPYVHYSSALAIVPSWASYVAPLKGQVQENLSPLY